MRSLEDHVILCLCLVQVSVEQRTACENEIPKIGEKHGQTLSSSAYKPFTDLPTANGPGLNNINKICYSKMYRQVELNNNFIENVECTNFNAIMVDLLKKAILIFIKLMKSLLFHVVSIAIGRSVASVPD